MRYAEVKQLQKAAEEAAAQNTGWHRKLSVEDTMAGLEVARRHEDSFWRFLSGRWRRLSKTLKAAYDFSARAVPPTAVSLLAQLLQEYEAAATAQRARQSLETDYRIAQLEMTWLAVERLRGKLHEPSLQYLLHHPQAAETVRTLSALQEPLLKLETLLSQTLADPAPSLSATWPTCWKASASMPPHWKSSCLCWVITHHCPPPSNPRSAASLDARRTGSRHGRQIPPAIIPLQ